MEVFSGRSRSGGGGDVGEPFLAILAPRRCRPLMRKVLLGPGGTGGHKTILYQNVFARAQNGRIMATELTVKERAFAQLIIEGTQVAAYRKVYSARGNANTQTTNAYKLSRRPKIKREVARLLRQREFPADDYARIRDLAVAGLTEIFLQEPDPRLRAKVGSVLLAYADAGLKLHPVPSEKERKFDELSQFVSEVVRRHQEAVGRGPQQPTIETHQTEAPFLEVESDTEAPGQETRNCSSRSRKTIPPRLRFTSTPRRRIWIRPAKTNSLPFRAAFRRDIGECHAWDKARAFQIDDIPIRADENIRRCR